MDELDQNPATGPLDTVECGTSDDRHTSGRSNSLIICPRCRIWGYISIHNMDEPKSRPESDRFTTMRQYASIEQLAKEHQCAMCVSILASYRAWIPYLPNASSWPTSRIVLEISGPFYLDPGLDPSAKLLPRRGDRSNPDHIVVRMFLRLEVKGLPPPKTEAGNETSEQFFVTTPSGNDPTDEFRMPPTWLVATPRFKMTYSNDEAKALVGVEEWDVPFFDVNLLKSWLKRCEDCHGSLCAGEETEKMSLPAGFRVIDTHENKIVQLEGSFRYVALSYMWKVGPDNNFQLEKDNVASLEEPHSLEVVQLPNIVADAIALCRDLGERYLWIDRLCIVQDDIVGKLDQINAMDAIYRSASFTIIGALDTRDDIGLPGYAGRPRHPSIWWPAYKPEVESQGIRCGEIMSDFINPTLWNRRGWTFQERLLSRRSIFITHHQVIYECFQDEAMELLTWATHEESSGDEASGALGSFTRGVIESEPFEYRIWGNISLLDYCRWVFDYTSRQLSNRGDALNAFNGVSNVLERALNSPMLFCIPEKSMASCLFWDCFGPFSHQGEVYDVPSWSWVSSSKAVGYGSLDSRRSIDREFFDIVSIVYFYFQDPNGGLRKLDVEERWVKHGVTIQELSERGELPTLSGKHIPAEWRTNEDWKECPQNPWIARKHEELGPDIRGSAALFPGCLVFNTTVASLRIGQLIAGGYPTEVTDAPLIDKNDNYVGNIRNMDRGWIAAHCSRDGIQKWYEIVVITSGLDDYSLRKRLGFEKRHSEMWVLHVMMVERLPCKQFVARRIGVGKVIMSRWKDCNPRWETVILC
ncbi:heterokaryon incompatibility protein-domain-containing protein [Hypoxylon trugodes]|uniref:heterokaryon incompatibility protein-domain-containing protein n=1 Tax=Hypoxylon trugodes TaxID=326681 RepID=UPI00219EB16C|nr:heterokaryon incompatibility protein-domain-containing protein [Hypoxylon trugodes]KAI1390054.1 heterokaryon incompatibility protein-domain-containing protein [Hypoxylon trugodes]